MKIIKISKTVLAEAIKVINRGGVIVCPSDTVYGLVCDAGNKKAVEKIFKIKKRPKTKPLGVFVRDIKMARRVAVIDERAKKFLKRNTPGKITVILKKRPNSGLAKLVGTQPARSASRNEVDTVGIRIIKDKFINELLDNFGKPLAQTSANVFSQPFSTKIGEVLKQFENIESKPDLVIDAGDLPKSRPSAIIDLTYNKVKILR